MKFLNEFILKMVVIQTTAFAVLIFGGWVLTLTQNSYYVGDTFFTYRIQHLDCVPAWFILSLFLMVIDGYYIYRWAVIASVEGGIGNSNGSFWGNYDITIPFPQLKIIAVNLVSIPLLLFGFLVIRAMQW